MSYTYAERKRAAQSAAAEKQTAPDNLGQQYQGADLGPVPQMRQIDLAAAMRAKMENAFGTDFSNVKLYESQAVADAGAEAVAQGSRVAFAPGKADFSTRSGQELLGHELSHVVSQARGEVTGQGFLANASLEARADREGAMAAAGEQIYGGAAAPLSMASAAPAAGPMQAKRGGNQEQQRSPVAGPELIHERASWRDARYDWKHRFENESGRRMREEIAPSAMETASKIAAKNRVGDTRNYLRRGSARDRARWEVMDSMLDDDED